MTAHPRAKTAPPPADEDLGYDPSRPSKSQRKRDMTALQDLGVELVDLSRERLEKVALPEELHDAILEAQRIRSHEGRRRQLQYIGKLMRKVEVGPITAQLESWRGSSRAAAAALHQIEQWRENLLADDAALDQLSARLGPIDPQALATLRTKIRSARAEKASDRPPRHYRELFQMLKELLAAQSPAP